MMAAAIIPVIDACMIFGVMISPFSTDRISHLNAPTTIDPQTTANMMFSKHIHLSIPSLYA